MERAMERLRCIDREGPRCVLHGDYHLGNPYFDAAGAVFSIGSPYAKARGLTILPIFSYAPWT